MNTWYQFKKKKKNKNLFFLTLDLYIFHLKIHWAKFHSDIYSYSFCIFNLRIRYSWILWKIFVNRNKICKINIFANRNNIHKMKLWRIEIGIYSWPEYQQIDLWQIYSPTIHKIFASRELFAEHCSLVVVMISTCLVILLSWTCLVVLLISTLPLVLLNCTWLAALLIFNSWVEVLNCTSL